MAAGIGTMARTHSNVWIIAHWATPTHTHTRARGCDRSGWWAHRTRTRLAQDYASGHRGGVGAVVHPKPRCVVIHQLYIVVGTEVELVVVDGQISLRCGRFAEKVMAAGIGSMARTHGSASCVRPTRTHTRARGCDRSGWWAHRIRTTKLGRVYVSDHRGVSAVVHPKLPSARSVVLTEVELVVVDGQIFLRCGRFAEKVMAAGIGIMVRTPGAYPPPRAPFLNPFRFPTTSPNLPSTSPTALSRHSPGLSPLALLSPFVCLTRICTPHPHTCACLPPPPLSLPSPSDRSCHLSRGFGGRLAPIWCLCRQGRACRTV